MKPIRKTIKFVAAFLLVNTLYFTFLPSISYALTSGPTAPEATSFEPVDTTDMVNLQTGDFTYNIPLLEVPGPSGGYPLALSYHAGIQPNEEASWVGLGWTLNPGAISRSVNGYADDFKNVKTSSRDFWSGGEYRQRNFGLSYGIPGSPVSFSAGLSISNDTFDGYGENFYLMSSFDVSSIILGSISAGALSGRGTIGKSSALGINLANPTLSKKSILNYVGFGYQNHSTGISISSVGGGIGFSSTVGNGESNTASQNKGDISTKSGGFSVSIPILNTGLWLNIGKSYQRYWIDKIKNVDINGAMYFPAEKQAVSWYDEHDYDSYSIIDRDAPGSFISNPNPLTGLGGTFPNGDDYSVNAQGVSGSMKLHLFQKHLDRRNTKINKVRQVLNYHEYVENDGNGKPQFRFANDFSNQFKYTPPDFDIASTSHPLKYTFESVDPITGDSFDSGIDNGVVAGSRHIKYFLNSEIKDILTNGTQIENGYLKTNSAGFLRSESPDDQIGSYIITNESGVKYHFALPAYSHDEFSFSQNLDTDAADDGVSFNYSKRWTKYAYTWYLTAITGPDFVDRGTTGEFDEEDYGYWVEFEYGKWTDDYVWRNPTQGFNTDIDGKFKSFSRGKKELYYLNTIKTKTHVAVFEKEIRADAKGTTIPNNTGVEAHHDEGITYLETGGFDPLVGDTGEYEFFPKATLKLSNIYLLKSDKYESIVGNDIRASGQYNHGYTHDYSDAQGQVATLDVNIHNGDFVNDITDSPGVLKASAIKVFNFDHDYSLADKTPNSFDKLGSLYGQYPDLNMVNEKLGKLTLISLEIQGKSGAKVLPPTKFLYDYETPISSEGKFGVTEDTKEIMGLSQEFHDEIAVGDIVKFQQHGNEFFALIIYEDVNSHVNVNIISDTEPVVGSLTNVRKTKNPLYQKDCFDIWGMFKSDAEKNINPELESIQRRVTDVSAKSLDAWSLRSIKSSIGAEIKINYEADRYKKPELYQKYSISIKSMEQYIIQPIILIQEIKESGVKIYVENNGFDISGINSIDIYGSIGYPYKWQYAACAGTQSERQTFTYSTFDYPNWPIYDFGEDSGGKFIIIDNQNLYDKLSREAESIPQDYTYSWDGTNNTACDGIGVTHFYTGDVDFLGGNVLFEPNYGTYQNNEFFGGGIRVKNISISGLNSTNSTVYSYLSGTTAYEPTNFNKLDINFPERTPDFYNNTFKVNSLLNVSSDKLEQVDTPKRRDEVKSILTDKLTKAFDEILDHSAALPAPGVIYGIVDVSEWSKGKDNVLVNHLGKSRFNFRTFRKDMVTMLKIPRESSDVGGTNNGSGLPFTQVKTREIKIQDHTSILGSLLSQTDYDAKNKIIKHTKNNYLFTGDFDVHKTRIKDSYNSQGIIEETFVEGRIAIQNHDNDNYYALGTISKIERLPNIKVGSEVENRKLGITTTTQNLAFDFYSGNVTKTLSTDGYGNSYVSETVPAYRKYPSMGLAINGGANMLTQVASTQAYKTKSDTELTPVGLVSASVQTWSDEVTVNIDNKLPPIGTSYTAKLNKKFVCPEGLTCVITHPHHQYYMKNSSNDFVKNEVIQVNYSGEHYDVVIKDISNNEYNINFLNSKPSIELDINYAITGTHLGKYKQKNIWRKHASYSWLGNNPDLLNDDGLYKYQNDDGSVVYFEEFDAWDDETPSDQWQKNAEITRYDINSHALEATDINGNYAATKMDVNHEKVFASVANASYNEFAYSGAEGGFDENLFFGGEVKAVLSSGIVLSKNPIPSDTAYPTHTGEHSLGLVNDGTVDGKGFVFNSSELTKGRTYKVSLWTNATNGKVYYDLNNSGTLQFFEVDESKKSGDWYQINGTITIDANFANLEIGAINQTTEQALFDDFRFQPLDAPMTAYVYDEATDELTHILDNNNLYTKYEYDDVGRLTNTYKESFKYGTKKISEIAYNYGRKYYDNLDLIDAGFEPESHKMINQMVSLNPNSNAQLLTGITTSTWDYGDGSATDNISSHTYAEAGVHKVKLTVENPDYGAKQTTKMLAVYEGPYTFNISEINNLGSYDKCLGGDISAQFELYSVKSSYACPSDVINWKYNINGGNEISLTTGSTMSFNLLNASITGAYKFWSIGIDKCGNDIQSESSIIINVIDSSESGTLPCAAQ